MPESAEQRQAAQEITLEGGDVRPLEDYPIEKRHREETARYLAYGLVATLAGSVLLQYALTVLVVFFGKSEGVTSLDKNFNVLLPALTGLVGGACTYYFTKERG